MGSSQLAPCYHSAHYFRHCSTMLLQVQHLAETLQNPFTEQEGAEEYIVMPPKRIRMGVEMLSCSS